MIKNFVSFVFSLLLLGALPVWAASFKKHEPLIPVGPNPSAIVAGDLNGDGVPDMVTADRGVLNDPREEQPANNELSVLMARGPLDYEKHHPSPRTDSAPYALALANIDALKWPDILAVSFLAVKNEDLHLFLNLRSENILEPHSFRIPDETLAYARQRDGDGVPLFTTPGLTSLAVADFDQDELRDVVMTAWSSDALIFLPGEAEGYFGEARIQACVGGPRDVALGDFNGDGNQDLAVTLYGKHQVALFRGDGAGNFEEVQRFSSRGRLPNRIRQGDMDGDGRPDLAVAHGYTDDSVSIFYGTGDFQFNVSEEILLGEDREVLEHEIRDIALDDFDLDGRLDLAAACFSSATVQVFLSGNEKRVRQVHGYPRESYQFKFNRDEAAPPRALCTVDFDGNGAPDIAAALWNADAVGILLSRAKPEQAPKAP
jgi:hypothetical protein